MAVTIKNESRRIRRNIQKTDGSKNSWKNCLINFLLKISSIAASFLVSDVGRVAVTINQLTKVEQRW